MSDEADRASEMQEFYEAGNRMAIKNAAEKIPAGVEGECDLCGKHFARLVSKVYKNENVMACARCRDQFKLG
jgi:predicted SprT family Zn-dependent metalloprotease